MFLIVRHRDDVIIGSAIKPINIDDATKNGYYICEIPDDEYSPTLMGMKIDSFEEWND